MYFTRFAPITNKLKCPRQSKYIFNGDQLLDLQTSTFLSTSVHKITCLFGRLGRRMHLDAFSNKNKLFKGNYIMPSRIPQTQSMYSNSSSRSSYSHSSDFSLSTAPTAHSERPSIQQYKTIGNPHDQDSWDEAQCSHPGYLEPRDSVDIYASTTSSIEDLGDDLPPFEVPGVSDYPSETPGSTVLTSSPEEFAEYFPSTQMLSIRHDDSTMDGNMNLRIDTEAQTLDGRKIDLQLFHLRMHDLKRREFSLRRYSRDSGREVCHSSRKYTKPSVIRRPGLQRSMSSAFTSLRSKSESKTTTAMNLNRHDSGYGSLHGDDIKEDVSSQSLGPSNSISIPTNTTQLEFSNYAHLEVKRRGVKTSKRYEMEYWGTKYAWKRAVVGSGHFEEVSYHLVNTRTSAPLAHIVPVSLSESKQREETAKGGWVPPCKMTLEDSVLDRSTDLADVVMASGLVVLVDDCIKRRWHQKRRMQMTVPMLSKSPLRSNIEYVGPKRLIDEVFNRREKSGEGHRPTPLRQITY